MPTTSPNGAAIISNPASLSFIFNPKEACPQANQPQSFGVSEQNYAGTFTATIDKSADATVAASTSANTFVVTPSTTDKAQGEIATVTVTDSTGNTGTVSVKFNTQGVCL